MQSNQPPTPETPNPQAAYVTLEIEDQRHWDALRISLAQSVQAIAELDDPTNAGVLGAQAAADLLEQLPEQEPSFCDTE